MKNKISLKKLISKAKENKDWAYVPSVGGWLYLGYIKG